jgi:hypothetical protein
MNSGVVGFAAALVPWGVALLGYFEVVCVS